MGNTPSTDRNGDDVELALIPPTDEQTHVRAKNNITSWWDYFFGATTDNCRDQRSHSTKQSDEETAADLRRQEDVTDDTEKEELLKRLKAAEKEIAENRTTIKIQEETMAALEHQLVEEKRDKQLLRTRLSQISSMQLTEGNPNIADLSDPNRPDKLAEQFSELYDNLWTDSFQVLCERRYQDEEKAISVLLKIIMTVYEVCKSHAENQNRQLIESMCMFTGVEVGDSIIRESLHNLRNFRAKHFSSTMADIKKIIEKSLPSIIGSEVYIDCQDYIAECTTICWLMCIKSPPMYISAGTTNIFDHNLYTSYTKSGKHVSYVVWPTLFQYNNGPLMKKGVAQGTS